ncbi:hypothetical protein BDA99DRAFT_572171 [Phascolomyces articulosus]|uniref:HMG box domain-containing protein n=1 Tax=Phascolomyces articulosus TaxID=60185 RepID=A0AAD5PDK5_9FUNG|nr:hypothetical protein BDA99DRAFT_572171 [Phascolomyces articulosus]
MPRTKTTTTSSMEPKVPRPMNCFLAFRLEKQGQIVDMVPGANHRDISKLLAKWWKELSEEEKEPYRERARQAKLEHAEKYPNYRYQPQKCNGRKTRKYVRRPQDKFTSRHEKNNRIMELFYQDPQHFFSKSSGNNDQQQYTLPEEQHESAVSSSSPMTVTTDHTNSSNILSPEYITDKDTKIMMNCSNSSPQSYAYSSCSSSNMGSPLQTPPVITDKNILFSNTNSGCMFSDNIIQPDDYVLPAESYSMTTAPATPSVMVPSQRDVSSYYDNNVYGFTEQQQLMMPMTTATATPTTSMINDPITTFTSTTSTPLSANDVLFDQFSYSPIETSTEWTLTHSEIPATTTQQSFFDQSAANLMDAYCPMDMAACIDPRLLESDYDFSTTSYQ